jgi:hypothetical protein
MLTAVPTVVSVGGSRPAKDATTAASARQITAGVASTSTEKLNRSEIKQLHANEGEKKADHHPIPCCWPGSPALPPSKRQNNS